MASKIGAEITATSISEAAEKFRYRDSVDPPSLLFSDMEKPNLADPVITISTWFDVTP
jgi:hypothetical protein